MKKPATRPPYAIALPEGGEGRGEGAVLNQENRQDFRITTLDRSFLGLDVYLAQSENFGLESGRRWPPALCVGAHLDLAATRRRPGDAASVAPSSDSRPRPRPVTCPEI